MKQWRPKGWRNPYIEEPIIDYPNRAFEAGADAMLGGILRDLLDKKIKFKRKKGCIELIPDKD